MNFIKTLLKSWTFWLCLIAICIILIIVDVYFDLSEFGILSLISAILALVFLIVFLVVRSANDGIRRLLTVVICTGVTGIISLLLYDEFYWDVEPIISLVRLLFFISGTILLLRLVWRKKENA